jgi:hypothetical protein
VLKLFFHPRPTYNDIYLRISSYYSLREIKSARSNRSALLA